MLSDKTALVVAASKGIGKGVALALARERCRVILTSSNADNLRAAKEELERESGTPVDVERMDVTSRASVADACAKILGRHGRVDILVTNGPGPALVPAATLSVDELMRAIESILVTPITLCTTFLPGMIANDFGRIIVLASSTAREPDSDLVLSNVARAGLVAYAKTLSREVAKYGITVNSILTGGVLTERSADLMRRDAERSGISYEEVVARASSQIPVGYIATPAQFAHAIAFLASPRSMYVNGVSLPLDGGAMRAI